jgi:hypothetical protein
MLSAAPRADFFPDRAAVFIYVTCRYHAFATWGGLSGSGIPYFAYTYAMLNPWFKRN